VVKNIKGKVPKPSPASFAIPAALVNHDDESPKFCLHFLAPGFDVHALDPEKQASFAKTLQKLASSSWKDLKLAPRHGQGVELIPARELKPSVPEQFQDETKFMVFRFHGKLPMAGVRVDDVYHVLWIEPQFGRLYNHG
jgi:hypothetical protein